MKKCIFYLTALMALSFTKNPQNLYGETSWSLSTVSSRLQLPNLTFRSTWSIPETSTSQTPELKTPASGLELRFQNTSPFSAQFKLGHLTPSGSLTRLKSPALSASTALAAKTGSITPLTIALPQSNSTRPEALSVELKYSPQGFLRQLTFLTYNDSQGTLLESAYAQLRLSQKTFLSFSALSGQFTKYNQGSTWFSSTSFFPPQEFFAHNLQLGLSTPHFTAKNSLNLYQCFTATPDFTITSENSLFFGDFLLNFAFFLAGSQEIYTTGSTRLKTLSQIRINPQLNFYPFQNQLKIRTGILFMMEEKLNDKNQKNLTGRTSVSTAFITKKSQVKITAGITGIELMESQNFSAALQGTTISGTFSATTKRFLKPATTLGGTVQPAEEKYSIKAAEKITLPGKNGIWLGATSASSFCRDEITDSTLKLSAGGSIKTKILQLQCTAGFVFDFFD